MSFLRVESIFIKGRWSLVCIELPETSSEINLLCCFPGGRTDKIRTGQSLQVGNDKCFPYKQRIRKVLPFLGVHLVFILH